MSDLTTLTPQDLIETFEFLGDWDERYRFIMDLGKQLPPMPPEEMTEENRVHGCQATVHLVAERPAEAPETVVFRADADAFIVKGLIAILMVVYSGKPAGEILEYDIEGLFKRFELREHLSSTRSNGLHAMVRRIRELAGGEETTPAAQGLDLS